MHAVDDLESSGTPAGHQDDSAALQSATQSAADAAPQWETCMPTMGTALGALVAAAF